MFSYHSEYHTDEDLLKFKNQIKQACDGKHTSAQAMLPAFLQICDLLTHYPTLSERAIRTIRKLICKEKGSQLNLNALNLLDCIIKNVPNFSKHLAADCPGFLNDMVSKLPKHIREGKADTSLKERDPVDVERIDRTLVLIQQWGLVLTKYLVFPKKYEELMAKGVIFPSLADGDQLVIADHRDKIMALNTPQRHPVPAQQQQIRYVHANPSQPIYNPNMQQQVYRPPQVQQQPQVNVAQQCANATEAAELLRDMLTATEEGSDLRDNELIQESLAELIKAKQRLLGVIQSGRADEMTLALALSANDEVDHTHTYYQNLLAGRVDRSPNKRDQLRRRPSEQKQPVAVVSSGGGNDILGIGQDVARQESIVLDPSALAQMSEEEQIQAALRASTVKAEKSEQDELADVNRQIHEQEMKQNAGDIMNLFGGDEPAYITPATVPQAAYPVGDEPPPYVSPQESEQVVVPTLAPPPKKDYHEKKSPLVAPVSGDLSILNLALAPADVATAAPPTVEPVADEDANNPFFSLPADTPFGDDLPNPFADENPFDSFDQGNSAPVEADASSFFDNQEPGMERQSSLLKDDDFMALASR